MTHNSYDNTRLTYVLCRVLYGQFAEDIDDDLKELASEGVDAVIAEYVKMGAR